jgi:hypothetical protein
MESVIAKGDLSKLTSDERVRYYSEVCKSIGLNPLTRPFEYLVLNGRTVLYPRRDAADQLRKKDGISIEIVSQEMIDNALLSIHVRAIDKTGRKDEDLGIVPFVYPERYRDPRDGQWKAHPRAGQPLRNEDRANAIMKTITKAKRRVTLSIAGLGFDDEGEDDVPDVRRPKPPAPNVMTQELPPHDPTTGEITAAEVSPPAEAAPPPGEAPVDDNTTVAGSGADTKPLSLEDMAREAARRGDAVFRAFYVARSEQEKKRVNAIGDELRGYIEDAEREMAADAEGQETQ